MQNIRNSKTHPIIVNFLKKTWQNNAKLGMAQAPGRCKKDQEKRNLQEDFEVLKNKYKINTIVSLLQQNEHKDMEIENELKEAQKFGFKTFHYPVKDMSTQEQANTIKKGVKEIVEEQLKKGKNVMVHCELGTGRALTFAAACLIYEGLKADQAIKQVEEARDLALKFEKQRDFLQKLQF